MQTHDIVIFTVILTSVSLASAQSTLLHLSDKADEVPMVNKIIGMLGLCSAAFALFFSRIFMGKVESTILMLLVLAIVFISWLTRKIKNARGPQPEKIPIPDTAISSFEPNPELAWCGNCKAHTLSGEVTVSNTNEYGKTYMSYQRKVCGHCNANMLWNIPSHIRQSTNWTLGCSGVFGLATIAGLIAYGFYKIEIGIIISVLTGTLMIPVLAFLVWVLYLRLQWCHWLQRQPRERSVYPSNEAKN